MEFNLTFRCTTLAPTVEGIAVTSHTFTREELYELVWSEPMTKISARLGISGTGLAKACRRANVPVPERGYWNKRQAGHEVTKTPLPPVAAGIPLQVSILPPVPKHERPSPPPIPPTVQEKIETERQVGKPIVIPATLANPHRIVAGWLEADRRRRRDRRHDSWFSNEKPIDGTDLGKRRLRILSALFKALESRGYSLVVRDSAYSSQVELVARPEKLEITLQEHIRQVRRQLTEAEKIKRGELSTAPKWTQERVPSGGLILTVAEPNRHGIKKAWRDTPEAKIESVINDVIPKIAGLLEELRLLRERHAEQEKQRWAQESERLRQQMERNRETIRVRRLVAHSDDMTTAASIRALVGAVSESQLATQNPERFGTRKEWALAQADRIDPLRGDDLFDLDVSDHEVYALRDRD